MSIKKGSTSVSVHMVLFTSGGVGATGLTLTDLSLRYTRPGEASVVSTGIAHSAVTDAYAVNEIFAIDDTNQPGLVRVDFPDGAFAAGADEVSLAITGAAILPAIRIVELTEFDPQNAAAADAAETIVKGATEAGTLTTTVMTTDLTEATADHYVGKLCVFKGGALAGQASSVTAYSASGQITLSPALTEAPIAAQDFVLV